MPTRTEPWLDRITLDQEVTKARRALFKLDNDLSKEIVGKYERIIADLQRDIDRLFIKGTADVLTTSDVFQDARADRMLWQYKQRLLTFMLDAHDAIVESKRLAVDMADEDVEKQILASLRDQARASGAPASAIDAMEATIAGGYTHVDQRWAEEAIFRTRRGRPLGNLLAQIADDGAEGLRDTLMSGIARGQSIDKLKNAMSLASNVPLTRLRTIARTETIGIYRDVTSQAYRNSPVVAGWVWDAALDERTCMICWAENGTHYPVSEQMDSHVNCRCTMIPETKSWDDLGFSGIKDTQPAAGIPSPEEQFGKLSDVQKLNILGPSRYAAYQKGNIKLSDLVRQTSHPVWGPSRRAATLRELGIPRVAGRRVPPPSGFKQPKPPGRTAPALVNVEKQAREAIENVISLSRYRPGAQWTKAGVPWSQVRTPMPHLHVGPSRGNYGDYIGHPHPGRVRVDPNSPHTLDTAVHEYGHWVDNKLLPETAGLPTDTLRYGLVYASQHSTTGAGGTIVGIPGVMRAIKRSRGWKGNEAYEKRWGHSMYGSGHYMTSPVESFTRAFVQWIASKQPNTEVGRALRHQFQTERATRRMWYWQDEDFAPIAKEFDKLFRKRGMLKE